MALGVCFPAVFVIHGRVDGTLCASHDSQKGQGVLGPAASIVLPDVPEPRLYDTWVFLKIMENTEGH